MIVDSHNHFWVYNEKEYEWIDDSMHRLRGDFMPTLFESILGDSGVDACIAVQARQTISETKWLLELSKRHDIIKGVIGWVDLSSPSLEKDLEKFDDEPLLKGFRHVLQGEDDEFMLKPEFTNGIRLIESKGYCYEILISAPQLPTVLKLIDVLPEMRLIVDHIAKPDLISHDTKDWYKQMQALSERSHLHCKLSGMVTEADWGSWTSSQIEPYIRHVIECFGGDRVLFGSDWPVCLVASEYRGVKNLLEEVVDRDYPEIKERVFGRNAENFYLLDA